MGVRIIYVYLYVYHSEHLLVFPSFTHTLPFTHAHIFSTTLLHHHYHTNMSRQRSQEEEVEFRVHRSLREAHQETMRQLEVAHELYDRAAIAHEAATRSVRAAVRTFLVADRLRSRPHPPRFPLGVVNCMMRDAVRTHRHALDTMGLTASSFQYAVTHAH